MKINHTSNDEFHEICVDTKCNMFVIDRQHLFKFQSQIEIKKTTKFVKIRDIDNTLHENFEYVEMNFFILKRLSNENETIVHFMQKIHIVDDFRVNMLLKSNIFDSKKTIIDMKRKFVIFSSCQEFSISVDIIVKKRRISRTIKNAIQLTISIHFCVFVSMKIKKKNYRMIVIISFIQKKISKI